MSFKIYLENEWKETMYMHYIAGWRNTDDISSIDYRAETLFQLDDGSFVSQCDFKYARLRPPMRGVHIGSMVFTRSCERELNPAQWLVNHQICTYELNLALERDIRTDNYYRFNEIDVRTFLGEPIEVFRGR